MAGAARIWSFPVPRRRPGPAENKDWAPAFAGKQLVPLVVAEKNQGGFMVPPSSHRRSQAARETGHRHRGKGGTRRPASRCCSRRVRWCCRGRFPELGGAAGMVAGGDYEGPGVSPTEPMPWSGRNGIDAHARARTAAGSERWRRATLLRRPGLDPGSAYSRAANRSLDVELRGSRLAVPPLDRWCKPVRRHMTIVPLTGWCPDRARAMVWEKERSLDAVYLISALTCEPC